MPQTKTYTLEEAIHQIQGWAKLDFAAWGDPRGFDVEEATAGMKTHVSFQAFPSAYRKLVQVELHRDGIRHIWNSYYLLVETWDRTYRIEDLQADPTL